MPQGCDFLCGNDQCADHGKRITLHGPWPVKDINQAIAEAEGEHKAGLLKLQAEGRKTALFVYPDDKDSEPIGWRIQLYCAKDKVIFEVEFSSIQDANDASMIEQICTKCGGSVVSLKLAVQQGIICPSCSKVMDPNWWFTKSS